LSFSKGLNIISALNSGGKSQLFNAFYWTFFNTIYVDNDHGKKEWKSSNHLIVCPDKLRVESKQNETIKSSIEITLSAEFHLNDEPQDEIITYTFLKEVTYEKTVTNTLIAVLKPELTISYVKDGETEFIPSHQHSWFLEKIFPSSIRKFMWYQGETMDELYDFRNPSTLKNAIKEISYFPLYDNMEKIVKAASLSIDRKVEKELKDKNKLTSTQQNLIASISNITNKIESKEKTIEDLKKDIDKLNDDVAEVEHDLKGYDKYRDLKEQLVKFEADLEYTKKKIDDVDINIKETLINKWMLNGCEELIKGSEPNLSLLNEEIKNYQQYNNPIPLSLPGPEYVERMLMDSICYICEREVVQDTPPFEALKRRLNDFESNANYKVLQDNYTELNRARRRLLNELPDIVSEIEQSNKERENLIKKRNTLNRKIKDLYENSGQEDGSKIITGAMTATQMLSKIQSFRNSMTTKARNLEFVQRELDVLKEELTSSKVERDRLLKGVDTNIVESVASDYIKMFVKAIGKLRAIAYTQLIKEIQDESNRLYTLYLGGKPQGEIQIDSGIKIIDRETKEVLSELNTAELVAQKIAVANAFLSLSEKKMKRSYPIVADAPTSDFDPDNTYNLTVNIGHSFDQMIIMSKDYSGLTEGKRLELIRTANIQKFYEFKNDRIDPNGPDSRTNRKTYITQIK